MPWSPWQAAANKARQTICATCDDATLSQGPHSASVDLGEIAVDEAFLHVFHLAPVDALGAGVVAVGQELALDRLGQFDRASRAKVCVGPDCLALIRQQVVDDLLRL